MKVCINSWAGYNAGNNGEWFSWPLSEEDEQTICKMEEPFIVTIEDDYINPFHLGCEKIAVSEFLEIWEKYENLEPWDKKVFAADIEVNGKYALEDFREKPSYVYDLFLVDATNDYELGVYCIEELQVLKIPEDLRNYFDYEAYGRDVSFDGSYTEHGFLFNR